MSKRHPAARYVLPEEMDPGNVYCCVPVPNDINHRAAFVGQLQALASARVWQNDESHSALDAAAIWRGIVDDLIFEEVDCGGPAYCPPVYVGTWDAIEDCDRTPYTYMEAVACNVCEDQYPIFAVHCRFNTPLEGIARSQFGFFDIETGLPSGIHVCSFRAKQTDATIGNAWNFSWHDCLGDLNVDDGQAGSSFEKFDFDMKDWCISSLAEFMYMVVIDGPILCTEA